MVRLEPLAFLCVAASACVSVAQAPAGSRASPPATDAQAPAASTGAQVPSPSQAGPELGAGNMERIERIRMAQAEEDLAGARELLRAAVLDLEDPEPGAEPARIALLFELDRLAAELGSLQESRVLRGSILDLRARDLPPDHPDVLAAKQGLSVTLRELKDLAGARALQEEVLEARERLLPPEHPDLLTAKLNLGGIRRELGDLVGALVLQEEVLEVRTRLLAHDHPDLLKAKQVLANTVHLLGDLDRARALREEVYAARSRVLPADHPDLTTAMQNLALSRKASGDLAGTRELEEQVLAARARLLPPDHPDLLSAKQNLAATLYALRDLSGANALFEEVLAARARVLPPDHPGVIAAKGNLAGTRSDLGDLEGALELQQEVVDVWTRLLPPDHPDLLAAKHGLGKTRFALGDLSGARAIFEELVAARTRLLAPDHPDLLWARQELATTKFALGDLAGARELEEVTAAWTRLLPTGHPQLLGARQSLAAMRFEVGDFAGARELQEGVLAERARLLPPDHPELLTAKANLALMKQGLGDLAGARELEEEVLAAWTRFLPAGHPDLLSAKNNLAATEYLLGDLAGAGELFEEVLAARTATLPAEHHELLDSRMNVAAIRVSLGDLAGARELFEELVAIRTRLLSSEHPDLLAAKQCLAATKAKLGDPAGARELFEEVLAAETRSLPTDHPNLLEGLHDLAGARLSLGDLAGTRELVARLLGGLCARATSLRAESARAAREGARWELRRLTEALYLGAASDPEDSLAPDLLAALESLRLASAAGPEVVRALRDHPELQEVGREIAALRTQLNDLAAGGPGEELGPEAWRSELLRLVTARDRAEWELRSRLAGAGVFVEAIAAGAIAAALTPDAAAVSLLRYERRFEPDPATGAMPPRADALLALVVRPNGAVRRVELGPAAELEELVRGWRAALGRPLEARGVGVTEAASGGETLEELGRRIRIEILDPVLAAAGGARSLHVVVDDVLHLVPLDALPLEDGLVGERLAIHTEVSLARLLRPRGRNDGEPALTLAGGIDYDAEPGEEALAGLDAASPPVEVHAERSGPGKAGFLFLPGTAREVDSIEKLFEGTFERGATTIQGRDATKAALHAVAPGTRYLHLATHGWFAPEAFRSQLDALAERGAREPWLGAEETLRGFAPETLCGLALAGANRGKDALGRVPGILTAEELATFDLRNCELAVLSACETNVGIRRAGQGIQSLQTALHAAGARTAITSLWKVDDAATRRLFELFYTKLWRSKLGKHDALWQAKMALRAEGHPPRDWAGWILTGDPE